MGPSPVEYAPPESSNALKVQHEVLRLSMRWSPGAVAWQAVITLLMAAYFGYPQHMGAAAVWAGAVMVGMGLRVLRPLRQPPMEALAMQQALRWHRLRVLFSAGAWGSAGILLFDAQDVFKALALTVALVSTSIAFSFSASSDGLALRLSMPLLIGPIVFSLLASDDRSLWTLGLIGASFVFLMLRLVQDRTRQLEETIDLRLQAQQARDAKQRFLAAASHDLRQPLQALNLYQGLLARGDFSPRVVDSMGQCLEALDRLLDGILDIARLDAGRVEVHTRPVHLPTMMLRVFRLHDPMARGKGLRLRLHVRDAGVHTDPDLLERILSNLLSNAIRYTRQGGVLVAARPLGKQIRLQVLDTGVGIAPEHLETVFEEFMQLGNVERAPDRGSGLGLATVRRLCQLLDLPVQVRSTPGRGSCFEIRLLMVPVPESQAEPPAPEGRTTGRIASRVLLVEDHALVRDALVQLMRGWQIEVLAVGTAEEALQALKGFPADTVISDWRLPGAMDGLTLLRRLREHGSVTRCILLTGELALESPPDIPVLRKPVRPLRLKSLLQQPPAQPDPS